MKQKITKTNKIFWNDNFIQLQMMNDYRKNASEIIRLRKITNNFLRKI